MTDIVDKATRSRMMAGIKGRDTRPELLVRRYLHGAGLRYRLHDPSLPGRPDVSLPAARTALFVHGCFWHRHQGCPKATTPTSRDEFWRSKFEANIARDARKSEELRKAGWTVEILWECQCNDVSLLDALVWRLYARTSSSK